MKKVFNQKKKIKVAIIQGGFSNEREVSLITGQTGGEHLDKTKFDFRFYDPKKELSKL